MSACCCMGPQPGHTLCPCLERVQQEAPWSRDLSTPHQLGCICPPTSEQTCQAPLCPRRGYKASHFSSQVQALARAESDLHQALKQPAKSGARTT